MTRFTYVGEHVWWTGGDHTWRELVWPGDEFEGEVAWHGMSFCYSFSERRIVERDPYPILELRACGRNHAGLARVPVTELEYGSIDELYDEWRPEEVAPKW